MEANQVGSKPWKPLRLSVRESTLKDYIPAGGVATFMKSLFEALQQMGDMLLRRDRKATDAVLSRLLRPSGERRGEEAASKSADEGSSVHYSIT